MNGPEGARESINWLKSLALILAAITAATGAGKAEAKEKPDEDAQLKAKCVEILTATNRKIADMLFRLTPDLRYVLKENGVPEQSIGWTPPEEKGLPEVSVVGCFDHLKSSSIVEQGKCMENGATAYRLRKIRSDWSLEKPVVATDKTSTAQGTLTECTNLVQERRGVLKTIKGFLKKVQEAKRAIIAGNKKKLGVGEKSSKTPRASGKEVFGGHVFETIWVNGEPITKMDGHCPGYGSCPDEHGKFPQLEDRDPLETDLSDYEKELLRRAGVELY